ncbi:MAG TPA: KpsF/GutQ family sugar-phosphate isomerase [Bacteroidota bacterium]|nr:KpsF/GutQ family sugar-phosphate isomerase [Bacteroidota bacterium]
MDKRTIIEKGREVIRIEAASVAALEPRIDESFARAVEMIYGCRGRTIVTGVGKSGAIARKIVATLNSTGTPAMFMHPVDAVHGDLGMARKEDVMLCLSKSGDTEELRNLLPLVKRIGIPVIAMVGSTRSRLADDADIVLDVSVAEEACPHDLAPTSSTTAALALGDALAMALLRVRNFTAEDFAFYHPGGTIGKRLLLKVSELMVGGAQVPRVSGGVPVRDAILEISSKRLGATCVVDASGVLVGIITDGDLRRILEKTTDLTGHTAATVMTKNPKTIGPDLLAVIALQEMEAHNITQLVVVDGTHKPIGVVHLHDLVKAGIAGES